MEDELDSFYKKERKFFTDWFEREGYPVKITDEDKFNELVNEIGMKKIEQLIRKSKMNKLK